MRTQVQRETMSTGTFGGLSNCARLFGDRQLATAVRVTAVFVVAAVTAQLVLGLSLAVLFNRRLPARPLLRSIMILPIFATPTAAGYLFFTIFYEAGGPLSWTGIPWLSDPAWALVSITLVTVLTWKPFHQGS